MVMVPATSLSESVLDAVARQKGCDQSELDQPLQDVVDVDSLDMLFRNGTGSVTFEYAGYEITVSHEGEVDLAPLLT